MYPKCHNDGMVLHVTCFVLRMLWKVWDVIIPSSLRLLLKAWIWYRCQIENFYHHDGE